MLFWPLPTCLNGHWMTYLFGGLCVRAVETLFGGGGKKQEGEAKKGEDVLYFLLLKRHGTVHFSTGSGATPTTNPFGTHITPPVVSGGIVQL